MLIYQKNKKCIEIYGKVKKIINFSVAQTKLEKIHVMNLLKFFFLCIPLKFLSSPTPLITYTSKIQLKQLKLRHTDQYQNSQYLSK